MGHAARAVAESCRWVATLSLDEPDAPLRPWRLFMAASWQSTAAGTAQPRPRPARTAPEPST